MRCHCASRRCENKSRWLVIVVGIAMSTSNEANIGGHASFQRVIGTACPNGNASQTGR